MSFCCQSGYDDNDGDGDDDDGEGDGDGHDDRADATGDVKECSGLRNAAVQDSHRICRGALRFQSVHIGNATLGESVKAWYLVLQVALC